MGKAFYNEYYSFEQDLLKATQWFQKAAEQGHVDAQRKLKLINYPRKKVGKKRIRNQLIGCDQEVGYEEEIDRI